MAEEDGAADSSKSEGPDEEYEDDEDDMEQESVDENGVESNLSFRLRMHAEHCKITREAIKSSSDEYDKNLLKLSTVFLGLSLTFMKDIVHVDKITHIYSLYISWCLFALTVLAVILSFQLGGKANMLHLAQLDDYYLKQDGSALNRANKWNTCVIVTNWISGTLFALGIAASVYFVIMNFRSS